MQEKVVRRASDWKGNEVAPPRAPAPTVVGADLLDLQRTAGNTAVVDLLDESEPETPLVQPKLRVGAVDDPAESAADRMAERALMRANGRSLNGAAFTLAPHVGCCGPSADASVDRYDVIRRHSSWEHRMLSDVRPEDLEMIVQGRDAARRARSNPQQAAATSTSTGEAAEAPGTALRADGRTINRANHVLTAEIDKLRWLRSTPMTYTEQAAKAFVAAGVPNLPEVTLVPLGLSDGTWTVLTYGELNTLADFYGNLTEVAQTNAANFRNIISGIRERELRGFVQIRAEVEMQSEERAKEVSYDDSLAFPGAIGDTGQKRRVPGMSDNQAANVELIGALPGQSPDKKKAELPGASETSQAAGLARNACHFAPYSWHAWADYHAKAVALAQEAHQLRDQAARIQIDMHLDMLDGQTPAEPVEVTEAKVEALRSHADELDRQALVTNGFGDHFLQDSFASGHLINKTLIMKWFAMWLDANPLENDKADNATWRRVQAFVYGQGPEVFGQHLYTGIGTKQSTDPQTAENMQGRWETRFEALGLQIPRSLADPLSDSAVLFKTWQDGIPVPDATRAAPTTVTTATMSIGALRDLMPSLPGKDLDDAVNALVTDGVIYQATQYRSGWFNRDTSGEMARPRVNNEKVWHDQDAFAMRTEYVPTKPLPDALPDYEHQVRAVAHEDHYAFLNRKYLQFAAGQLHDKFCVEGLEVTDDLGSQVMKIYGDNAMLAAGAAEGVRHSAETGRLSLEAIRQWSRNGSVDQRLTVNEISKRFPHWVKVGNSAPITIENWHVENGPLHATCLDLFPAIAGQFKTTVAGWGEMAPKVTKDKNVHVGEGF